MASACERAGVACVIPPHTSSDASDALREAVRTASADQARRRAATIAAELASTPPAASVVARLEALAASER
jgi:UDP:flavonoid glycosyltransferase YjiC (YdhE family)